MITHLVLFFMISEDDHNHGGDFGQYIVHAINIFEGRSWSESLTAFPAVLPGYSLMLLPIYAIFGVNFLAFSLLAELLWLGAYLMALWFSRKQGENAAWGYLWSTFVYMSTLAMAWISNTTPHVVFSALIAISLFSAYLHSVYDAEHRNRKSLVVIFIASTFVAAITRPEAAVLLIALALYPKLNKVFRLVAAISSPIPILLSYFIVATYDMREYNRGNSGILELLINSPIDFALQFGSNFVSLFAKATTAVFDPGNATITILAAIILFVASFGLLLKRDPITLALYGLVAFYALRAISDNVVNLHYLLVTSFLWTPALLGAFYYVRIKSLKLQYSAPVLMVLLLVPILFPSPAMIKAQTDNMYRDPSFQAAVDKISDEHKKVELLGFYKPRALILALAERGKRIRVTNVRNPEKASELIGQNAYVLVRNSYTGYGQKEVLRSLEELPPKFRSDYGESYVLFWE